MQPMTGFTAKDRSAPGYNHRFIRQNQRQYTLALPVFGFAAASR